MGRIVGYLIAGSIAAALLVYAFHELDALFGSQDAAIATAGRAQLALHPALERWRGRLLAAEQQNVTRGQVAHELASALRTQLEQGRRVDTVVVLQEIVRADSVAYQACSAALGACQQRAGSATRELDSLHAWQKEAIRIKKHPCGLLFGFGPVLTAGQASHAEFRGLALNVSAGCLVFPFRFP